MTAKELAKLVEDMRTVQKRFFRGDRSSETLDAAKRLERQVDRAVMEIMHRDDRPTLFGKED